jgi:protein LTV1
VLISISFSTVSTIPSPALQIERIYEEDSSEDEDPSDAEYDSNGDPIPSSDAPTLVTREDFDSILDDFIDNFEIVGNKLKPVMEGATPMEKLTTMREGMGVGEDAERERKRVLELNRQMEALGWDEEEEDAKLPEQAIAGEHKQGWDAETILSKPSPPLIALTLSCLLLSDCHSSKLTWMCLIGTYSTLENHPRLIDERVRVPRIEIDPKTGFPLVDGQATAKRGKNRRKGRGKPIEVLEQQLEEEEEEGGRLSGGEEEREFSAPSRLRSYLPLCSACSC